MNITMRTKAALGAVAIASAIGLSVSGAFTAGGLINNADQHVAGFVGGHIDQTISGAAISAVTYTLDATASNINTVTITTNAPRGKTTTVVFTGGTTNTATWSCVEDAITDGLFVCSVASGAQTVDATSLNIQVR